MTTSTALCFMASSSGSLGASARQLDLGGRVQLDAFRGSDAFDHLQIPSGHFGKTLDRIILEVERDLGELLDVAVTGAEHKGVEPAVENSAQTHRTGFASRIERAIRQHAPSELLGGVFDGERLRMGGGVACRYLEAAAADDQLAIAVDHDRAKRLFAL